MLLDTLMKTSDQIKLTRNQWSTVREQIASEHPKSVLIISYRMREVLGFTPRNHDNMVVLDFFDENQKSWFILKYL